MDKARVVRVSKDDGKPALGGADTVSRVMEPERLGHAAGLRPGDLVHPYKILEELGEGGFAFVYLAEQSTPVRRRVALKVLKQGVDSKEVVARFEAERQALALMDHRNVARVLDAGTTEKGRLYFAMEYVAGAPITEYCDRNKLTLRERLEVFSTVCDAIQHAHQNAIIHRDIKPSNVLVAEQDGAPVAKVIDFGVAKAIAHRLTSKTIHTVSGQLIGTPAYMSPEQAEMSNERIDTRTDIYSLGMLLYELLAGCLPFDVEVLKAWSVFEIQSYLRSVELPKPSDRILRLGESARGIAEKRRTDPKALFRALRGDLDWVVLKTLEKERSRRYDTPRALAEDLQRHLNNEPVKASPPSWAYWTRKFVRRHTVGVVAASITAVALVVVAVTMTTYAGRLATERDAAHEARVELERVVQFQTQQISQLDMELMGVRIRDFVISEHEAAMQRSGLSADEVEAQGALLRRLLAGTSFTDVALQTVDESFFAAAKESLDEQFNDDSLVRAQMLHTLATTMVELGLVDAAEAPQLEALNIRRRVLGEDHQATLASLAALGRLRNQQGRFAEANEYLLAALNGRRREFGNEHVDTLSSLNDYCRNLRNAGRIDEAEPYCREALQTTRRVLGDEHPHTMRALAHFGELLFRREPLEAESYLREVVAIQRRVLGPEHPDTLESLNLLGLLLKERGRNGEAESVLRASLEGARKRLGNEHLLTIYAMVNVSGVLLRQGKLDETELSLQEALTYARRSLGDRHQMTLTIINNMGFLCLQQGELTDAEGYFREALAGHLSVLGAPHFNTRVIVNNLAAIQNAQSRFRESEALLRESLPIHIEALGEKHWRTYEARSLLGEALTGLGRYEKAENELLEAMSGLEATMPDGSRPTKLPAAIRRVAELYEAWGKHEEAARWRAKLAP